MRTQREQGTDTKAAMNRPVAVIAHRGFSGLYPENTKTAFQAALDLGVDEVEFDVRLSRDGVPVLIHDETVDRTSNGGGRVAELTIDQIRRLDAGHWLSPSFAGERYVTLREALDLMGGQVILNIHIKAHEDGRGDIVSAVLVEIQDRGLLEDVYLASDERTLALARDAAPGVIMCNLSTAPLDTYIERSSRMGCEIIQPPNGWVNSEVVREAHENSLKVNPFYADSQAEMSRLTAAGVDGILTNYPDRLMDLRGGEAGASRAAQGRD